MCIFVVCTVCGLRGTQSGGNKAQESGWLEVGEIRR